VSQFVARAIKKDNLLAGFNGTENCFQTSAIPCLECGFLKPSRDDGDQD